QHDLAEHVVHLVRAGVVELVALEIDFGARFLGAVRLSAVLGEPLGEIERRRPSDVVGQIPVHLFLEGRIVLRGGVGLLQLKDQRHQRLGDETAAIDAEMAALVRPGSKCVRLLDGHRLLVMPAPRAARMNSRILCGSFCPGARSTPEDTSTPSARVMRSASPTFSASRPPESMNGTVRSTCPSNPQSKRRPRPPGRVAALGARASKMRLSATPT